VLQSVYRSFFLRHAEGEFAFTGWDGLWALLIPHRRADAAPLAESA
jgi:hypothetical protein